MLSVFYPRSCAQAYQQLCFNSGHLIPLCVSSTAHRMQFRLFLGTIGGTMAPRIHTFEQYYLVISTHKCGTTQCLYIWGTIFKSYPGISTQNCGAQSLGRISANFKITSTRQQINAELCCPKICKKNQTLRKSSLD